jgi:hypothetical protein
MTNLPPPPVQTTRRRFSLRRILDSYSRRRAEHRELFRFAETGTFLRTDFTPALWERIGWALLLAVTIWAVRGVALDRFVTADEHAWLARAGNLYRAISQGDWAGAFQQHHPGVTTMWAGVAGYLVRYPDYAQDAPGYFGWLTEEVEPFLRSQGHDPVDILAAGRAALVLAITITLTASFWIAARLFGFWPALIGFSLIAFDPFHIAHSRLLHIDGLVSTFMLLSVLAFLRYTTVRSWGALIVSGLAAGLAWLTRSPGFVLGPLALFWAGADLIARRLVAHREIARAALYDTVPITESSTAAAAPDELTLIEDGEPRRDPLVQEDTRAVVIRSIAEAARQPVGRWAIALAAWGLVAVLTFVLLWPAMWVRPWASIREVILAANEYAAEGHLKPTFFAGEVYAGDPGFWFYPVTYLWRSTPVVWIGVLLAGIGAILHWPPLSSRSSRAAAGALLVYALLFALFMNIGAKKFDRYLLPSYLPLDLLAGLGWGVIFLWVWQRRPTAGIERFIPALIALIPIGAMAWFALPTYPYYLSYYNPVLGGAANAPEVMMIGWGEGADAAARFLNAHLAEEGIDPAQVTVASGYTNGPFSYFFPGRTLPITFWHEADYAVVYAQDWQRQLPSRKAIAHYAGLTPLHVVRIDGLEYAHIYDLSAARLPDYVTDWGNTEPPPIRLVSFQLPAAAVSPGESFRAIFYFVNRAAIAENLNVLVRVVGPGDTEIARSDGWPWGSPTSTWQMGDVWPDGHDLAIPRSAAPGWYKVQVGFYDPATQALLPAQRAATGEPLGDLVTVDYVRVGSPVLKPPQVLEPAVIFGQTARLAGIEWLDARGRRLDPARARPAGETITLRLYWEARETGRTDYTVFVHGIGPSGEPVVQADQQPVGGFVPVSAWLPGQIVVDDHTFTAPQAAGEYPILVGMYNLETSERLPVSVGGQPAGDALEIGRLRIE